MAHHSPILYLFIVTVESNFRNHNLILCKYFVARPWVLTLLVLVEFYFWCYHFCFFWLELGLQLELIKLLVRKEDCL